MTQLPSLKGGRWEYVDGDPGDLPYAVYHVRWDINSRYNPGPFYRRMSNGNICYPPVGSGWYWSPEVRVGRFYVTGSARDSLTVTGAWVFHPTSDIKPFAFIEGLFNKRRALKKAGDGAEMGIKLGINSLYGKTAQQIGWETKDDGSIRIPPFHQLEWAGFITSVCRSMVLEAVLPNLGSVIAFETDAVFTSEPLNVKVGSGLGEWEKTEFSSLTYVSSGVYFGTTVKGETVKTRGVDLGGLTREEVLDKLSERLAKDRTAVVEVTRFIGAKVALAQKWEKWLSWVTMTKHITLEPTGKRMHTECRHDNIKDKSKPLITFGVWHPTICPWLENVESAEFPIEWINPDPEMSELSDLREGLHEYE
jgi:hypothetical protein